MLDKYLVAESCEHGTEPLGSIKGKESLNYLNHNKLFKKVSVLTVVKCTDYITY
jgi:hypothetical protein